MSPRADDRGQAGDRPDGHASAVVALHAVVEPDQRRLLARQAAGEGLDRRDVDARDRRDAFSGDTRRDALAEQLGADGRRG